MKNAKKIRNTLFLLGGIFLFLIGYFFAPVELETRREFFKVIAILAIAFLILGVKLICFARKKKGRLKLFLMITGFSAVGPFVFTLLHNVFYGLAQNFERLDLIFNLLHATSFIIAIAVCPFLFFVSFAESFWLITKEVKSLENESKESKS